MLPISKNNPKELVEKLQNVRNEASILNVENGIIHYICSVWIGTTAYTVRFEVPIEKSLVKSFYRLENAKDLLEFRTN